jgi:hypothetical protein
MSAIAFCEISRLDDLQMNSLTCIAKLFIRIEVPQEVPNRLWHCFRVYRCAFRSKGAAFT